MLLDIERQSGFTPAALLSRPQLKPQYRHLLEAFYEVSSGREIAEAVQPIRTAEVLAYCSLTGVAEIEERERLFRVIRHLDTVYIRWVVEKQKTAAKRPA